MMFPWGVAVGSSKKMKIAVFLGKSDIEGDPNDTPLVSGLESILGKLYIKELNLKDKFESGR